MQILSKLSASAIASHLGVTGGGRRGDAFRLLCHCLSDLDDCELQAAFAEVTGRTSFRWTDFIDLATEQLVAPTIAGRFDRYGSHDLVPDVVERYFHAMHRLNSGRNAHLCKEATKIATVLNKIDVVPTFLKGSACLLSGLYMDPGSRIMSDLDVLVPVDRSETCLNQLALIGYLPAAVVKLPRFHSVATLARKSEITFIDLHREVFDHPYDSLLSASDVLKNAEVHEKDGAVFSVPSETHQMVINIGHTQIQDRAYVYGFLYLRALHDFTLLTRVSGDAIDWREVARRFDTNKKQRAMGFHLLAARELLNAGSETTQNSGPSVRFLYRWARFLTEHPMLHGMFYRIVRVFELFGIELSRPGSRVRLLRNMCTFAWWRRNILKLKKGDF